MKRYFVIAVGYEAGVAFLHHNEAPDGDWVIFSDVQAERERVRKLLERCRCLIADEWEGTRPDSEGSQALTAIDAELSRS